MGREGGGGVVARGVLAVGVAIGTSGVVGAVVPSFGMACSCLHGGSPQWQSEGRRGRRLLLWNGAVGKATWRQALHVRVRLFRRGVVVVVCLSAVQLHSG